LGRRTKRDGGVFPRPDTKIWWMCTEIEAVSDSSSLLAPRTGAKRSSGFDSGYRLGMRTH
jgi:hypothetical protein